MSETREPNMLSGEMLSKMFDALPAIMAFHNDDGDIQVVLSHELSGLPRGDQRRLFRAFAEALREVRDLL